MSRAQASAQHCTAACTVRATAHATPAHRACGRQHTRARQAPSTPHGCGVLGRCGAMPSRTARTLRIRRCAHTSTSCVRTRSKYDATRSRPQEERDFPGHNVRPHTGRAWCARTKTPRVTLRVRRAYARAPALPAGRSASRSSTCTAKTIARRCAAGAARSVHNSTSAGSRRPHRASRG